MINGVDCVTRITPEHARNLKNGGYEFVGRYFCPESQMQYKGLIASEVKAMTDAGLRILCVFESYANRIREGAASGHVDGKRAYQMAKELGMPEGAAIYFACDYCPAISDYDAIELYLRAAAEEIPGYRVGLYGNYYICKAMKERGAAECLWQCIGWSNHLLYEERNVYQAGTGRMICGVNADPDECDDMDRAGLWNLNTKFVTDKPKEEPEWMKEALDRLFERGIMRGDNNSRDSLRPFENITRGEMAVMLDRVIKLLEKT